MRIHSVSQWDAVKWATARVPRSLFEFLAGGRPAGSHVWRVLLPDGRCEADHGDWDVSGHQYWK